MKKKNTAFFSADSLPLSVVFYRFSLKKGGSLNRTEGNRRKRAKSGGFDIDKPYSTQYTEGYSENFRNFE